MPDLYGHLGISAISPSLPPSCWLTVCSLPCNSLRQLLQPLFQLQGEFLVALLTHWFHVKLHKLVPMEKRVEDTSWKLALITPYFTSLQSCNSTLTVMKTCMAYESDCGQKGVLWIGNSSIGFINTLTEL